MNFLPTSSDSCEESLYPPFAKYANRTTFFTALDPPLPASAGYVVVIGFGVMFSCMVTMLVMMAQRCQYRALTSEYFNTAGRMVKTGLTASVIVSQWTWAATILQSSNVAWQYGVSGSFWYAAGATVQILLFGVLAIRVKQIAPNAHTFTEIVRSRWGRLAHITFLCFAILCNIIVTSMLLLGGSTMVEALTGMSKNWAAFLIPLGVIVYTVAGGLRATFLASYVHSSFIYLILVMIIVVVYIKNYSSDIIHGLIQNTSKFTSEQCKSIFIEYQQGKYACGPVEGNYEGSYLTLLSGNGFLFGLINMIGNLGTVIVDQSYWQSAIAARPNAAAKGFYLGGICWFSIPFSLATALGLSAVSLLLPITKTEAQAGLVPAAAAVHLLGTGGSAAILIMLFMAIVSSGSSECVAVSSLVAYDIYREYVNPNATGKDILRVTRFTIVFFGMGMGVVVITLHTLGLHMGWLYLFMGIILGPAVGPIWNLMNWKKASGKGAVIASLCGLFLGIMSWVLYAHTQEGGVTIQTLGLNPVMLVGNAISFLSSWFIHWFWSTFIDPQDYDFSTLNKNISLVENDRSGLSDEITVRTFQFRLSLSRLIS
mmetsp:Transcript_39491/g.92273  ORF Transcript_39491/g.92273 Transcript_39491/m.92273 type:complete len:597 (-) Transcript_39491:51-1841(-)